MLHCESCGNPLSLKAFWRCLRGLNGRSYPFVTVGGKRREQAVRWLCNGCARHAERLRQGETAPPKR